MASEFVVSLEVRLLDPSDQDGRALHSTSPVATFPTLSEAVAYTSACQGELLERHHRDGGRNMPTDAKPTLL